MAEDFDFKDKDLDQTVPDMRLRRAPSEFDWAAGTARPMKVPVWELYEEAPDVRRDFNTEARRVTANRDINAEFREMSRNMVTISPDRVQRLDAGNDFKNVPSFGGNASGAYAVSVTGADGRHDFFGVAKPRNTGDSWTMRGLAEGQTVESLLEKVVSDTASAAGFKSIVPSILFENEGRTGLKVVTPLSAWPVGPASDLSHADRQKLFDKNPRAWAEITAIDALFMNYDRHDGNVLSHPNAQGGTTLTGIDHGLAGNYEIGKMVNAIDPHYYKSPAHRQYLDEAIARLQKLGPEGIARVVDRLPERYATPAFKAAMKNYANHALATLDVRIRKSFDGTDYVSSPAEKRAYNQLADAKLDAARRLNGANTGNGFYGDDPRARPANDMTTRRLDPEATRRMPANGEAPTRRLGEETTRRVDPEATRRLPPRDEIRRRNVDHADAPVTRRLDPHAPKGGANNMAWFDNAQARRAAKPAPQPAHGQTTKPQPPRQPAPRRISPIARTTAARAMERASATARMLETHGKLNRGAGLVQNFGAAAVNLTAAAVDLSRGDLRSAATHAVRGAGAAAVAVAMSGAAKVITRVLPIAGKTISIAGRQVPILGGIFGTASALIEIGGKAIDVARGKASMGDLALTAGAATIEAATSFGGFVTFAAGQAGRQALVEVGRRNGLHADDAVSVQLGKELVGAFRANASTATRGAKAAPPELRPATPTRRVAKAASPPPPPQQPQRRRPAAAMAPG